MKQFHAKILVVVLAACLLFSLASCREKTNDNGRGEAKKEETSEVLALESEVSGEPEWQHENRAVVTALTATASTSDPFSHSNLNDRKWLYNCFEALFCHNGLTNEREARVGKDVQISEDGMIYTVEIFDTIYFQNGKHCTAEDIKRSYEYAKGSPYNTQFSGVVDFVEVMSEYTVAIHLKEPSSPFLVNSDQIFILDMDEVEEQGDNFGIIKNKAGTGAYYIDAYDPSVEIILTYHDQFNRPLEGKRPIPQIIFKVITDMSAAVIAFESGNLDYLEVQPSSFSLIQESGLYQTYLGQTTQSNILTMNATRNDVLSNKLVRQAVAYAIDYDAVLDAGLEGYGEVTGKLAYPEMIFAAPLRGTNTVYTYQPEKSKELLIEAGYPDGVDIGLLMTTAGIRHEKFAQVIEANLAEVGITVKLELLEQVTSVADAREGKYQTTIYGWYMMMDYDYLAGTTNFANNGKGIVKLDGANDCDYEKIFELFDEGRKLTDEEERRKIYTELDALLMDSAIAIPLNQSAQPSAWDKELYINTNKPYTYHFTQFWDCYWE